MANNWTTEQKKAIDQEGCNILVSAAAGSGKTAVLVERIIRKITDPEHPVDIDRLVIVTFTKAAAAEMKQRIRESIDRLIEQDHDNARLQRQLTLINNAQITTIDSFCLNIVRNYFSDLDLDPGFRTADQGEIKLLENDVMSAMLEEYYAANEPDFIDFVDAYGRGRDDSAMMDIILKVYSFARSYPWPEEWLTECLSVYQAENVEELDENPAVAYLMKDIRNRLVSFDRMYDSLEQICQEPQGPSTYLPAIQSDHAGLQMLLRANTFAEMTRLMRLLSFDALSRARDKNASDEKKEYVKAAREEYKKYINKKMKAGLFVKDAEGLLQDLRDNEQSVQMMIRLARDFSLRMQAEKRERNIIDFNDMEHMALNILVKREDGACLDTKAAESLREYYEEILIDEYQDSNMLQEVILTSISKGIHDPELNNVYMVGDVKQSIYKFRLACPELFIEKYNRYTSSDSQNTKIELQANFRSRANVLESTNDVFRRSMNEEFTGIAYDEKARLNPGFAYPVRADGTEEGTGTGADADAEEGSRIEGILFDLAETDGMQGSTDIVVIGPDDKVEQSEQEAEDEESAEATERELEAHAIANMICEMHDAQPDKPARMVFDKNVPGGYRPMKYSDIVILTRTVTGWADIFVNVLMSHGIPAYSDASQGYFNVREIKLILNYLTVIDNPLQDIPMAAVMLSYFGRYDTEELTQVRIHNSSNHLYRSLQEIADVECKEEQQKDPDNVDLGQNEKILNKTTHFLKVLEEYRLKSEIMSIHDLLWDILYNTGYYNYVGTMPAGDRRQANLDMLLEKAAAFEGTSYNGLFNFLRYIERIQKFDVDFGEACLLGENEDLVRVMSIHKSKGLEFPVVIVAGMGKKINNMDSVGEVVIDQQLGIGTNVYHLDHRVKSPTFVKNAVSMKLVRETISEELRVLYVAMTRAREKLILTGYQKDPVKAEEKWAQKASDYLASGEETFTYADAAGFNSYFDMVMPVALLPKEENRGVFRVITKTAGQINQAEPEDLQDNQDVQDEQQNRDMQDTCKEQDTQVSQDTLDAKVACSQDEYMSEQNTEQSIPPYPYEQTERKKMKITVSELKQMQHDADLDAQLMMEDQLRNGLSEAQAEETSEQSSDTHAELQETVPLEKSYEIPKFLTGEQKQLAGNERGTAYHRVMECMDYAYASSVESVRDCIGQMVKDEKMTQTQADSVEAKDIYRFCQSEIGRRVQAALVSGAVRREQPFIYAEPSQGMQLVQGVIDLYIREGDELTIIDYKTDRVPRKTGREELVKRYHIQLDYYARALEQLTGLKVKEKVIYSFTLGEAISLS